MRLFPYSDQSNIIIKKKDKNCCQIAHREKKHSGKQCGEFPNGK